MPTEQPTLLPSLTPTVEDAVVVGVSVAMNSSYPVASPQNIQYLRLAIAAALNVTVDQITRLQVQVDVAAARRLVEGGGISHEEEKDEVEEAPSSSMKGELKEEEKLTKQEQRRLERVTQRRYLRRSLLSVSYIWTVSFELVLPLSTSPQRLTNSGGGGGGASGVAANVANAVSAPSFNDEVTARVNFVSVVNPTSVLSVASTRNPTMQPWPLPTASPTPDYSVRCGLSLAVSSAGALDGNAASVSVFVDGVNTGLDNSFMGRGFNLVVFSPLDNSVILTASFDTYASSVRSNLMLSFLKGVPNEALVVMVAKNAVDFYLPSVDHFTTELKTYLETTFGATLISSLGWRDSYAMVGVKGTSASSSPLVEKASAAGSGPILATFNFNTDLNAGLGLVCRVTATSGPTVTDNIPAPTTTGPPGGPHCGFEFLGTSAGFSDGNDASLSVTIGSSDTSFDDSWFGRGFNVVAFEPESNSLLSTGQFDTFADSHQSRAMVGFLRGLPNSALVAILAKDAVETWKPGIVNFTPELKAYLEATFGATLISSLGWRDSYVMIGIKGANSPLVEQASVSGAGALVLDYAIDCTGPSAPSVSPAPSMHMVNTPQPTLDPYARCGLELDATSAGFADGNLASLTVSQDGVDTAYDNDSWMGRGFNVLAIEPTTNNVHSFDTFDTYSSSVQSKRMLNFLQGLPHGALVAILAMDAVETWKPGIVNFTPELKAYLEATFGATLISSLDWRDSYVMIGVKGANSPLVEQASASGAGPVVASYSVDCTHSPSVTPVPSVAVVPTTTFTRCGLVLGATSAGFADGNSASLTVSLDGADTSYDDSWMGRGFNVVVLDSDSNTIVSSATFDLYAGATESSSMIAFLQGHPTGSLVVVAAKDAVDFWVENTDNFTAELKAYLEATFGAILISSLGWRDSYVMIGVKGANNPLVEQMSGSGFGQVIAAYDFAGECTP
jgi:hypothetical protein